MLDSLKAFMSLDPSSRYIFLYQSILGPHTGTKLLSYLTGYNRSTIKRHKKKTASMSEYMNDYFLVNLQLHFKKLADRSLPVSELDYPGYRRKIENQPASQVFDSPEPISTPNPENKVIQDEKNEFSPVSDPRKPPEDSQAPHLDSSAPLPYSTAPPEAFKTPLVASTTPLDLLSSNIPTLGKPPTDSSAPSVDSSAPLPASLAPPVASTTPPENTPVLTYLTDTYLPSTVPIGTEQSSALKKNILREKLLNQLPDSPNPPKPRPESPRFTPEPSDPSTLFIYFLSRFKLRNRSMYKKELTQVTDFLTKYPYNMLIKLINHSYDLSLQRKTTNQIGTINYCFKFISFLDTLEPVEPPIPSGPSANPQDTNYSSSYACSLKTDDELEDLCREYFQDEKFDAAYNKRIQSLENISVRNRPPVPIRRLALEFLVRKNNLL